ncbi:hypothetical protein CDIK_0864 [Cucumispora dikerogammari]|nr:hypothetical protein CDIK_0864 [Cucumispora dikerogammari]
MSFMFNITPTPQRLLALYLFLTLSFTNVNAEDTQTVKLKHLIKNASPYTTSSNNQTILKRVVQKGGDPLLIIPFCLPKLEPIAYDSLSLPFLLIPLLKIDGSNDTDISSLFTDQTTPNKIMRNGSLVYGFQPMKFFFSPDPDVVKNIELNGQNIFFDKRVKESRLLSGFLILRDPITERFRLYLGAFINPDSNQIKGLKPFLSQGSLKQAEEKECPFRFDITINIGSFASKNEKQNVFSWDGYNITFDKSEYITGESELRVTMVSKIENGEMVFEITKHYSDPGLDDMTFNLIHTTAT